MKPWLSTLFAGIALLIPAALGLYSSETPSIFGPLPLLTVGPIMLLKLRPSLVVVIPSLLFFAGGWSLFRGDQTIPKRTIGLFLVLTVLDIIWFILGWNFGLRYQGPTYTHLTCAINAIWIVILAVLFVRWRERKISFRSNVFIHWLLIAWLAWYAFPYLGELI